MNKTLINNALLYFHIEDGGDGFRINEKIPVYVNHVLYGHVSSSYGVISFFMDDGDEGSNLQPGLHLCSASTKDGVVTVYFEANVGGINQKVTSITVKGVNHDSSYYPPPLFSEEPNVELNIPFGNLPNVLKIKPKISSRVTGPVNTWVSLWEQHKDGVPIGFPVDYSWVQRPGPIGVPHIQNPHLPLTTDNPRLGSNSIAPPNLGIGHNLVPPPIVHIGPSSSGSTSAIKLRPVFGDYTIDKKTMIFSHGVGLEFKKWQETMKLDLGSVFERLLDSAPGYDRLDKLFNVLNFKPDGINGFRKSNELLIKIKNALMWDHYGATHGGTIDDFDNFNQKEIDILNLSEEDKPPVDGKFDGEDENLTDGENARIYKEKYRALYSNMGVKSTGYEILRLLLPTDDDDFELTAGESKKLQRAMMMLSFTGDKVRMEEVKNEMENPTPIL